MSRSLNDVREFTAWAKDAAFNAVLPAHCASCGKSVDAPGRLCGSCWQDVSFIGAPHCACCGIPFELPQDGTALCGPCMDNPPEFSRARSVFMYEGVGRDMVLAFKMADRTWLSKSLADWLVRAGSALLGDADVIVPVPLHRWRLFHRRYNQSAMLATAVARQSGVSLSVDLLQRVRHTPPQSRLGASERRQNVRGAFRLRPGREDVVAGRRVLLLDDVLTTGATASACVQALRGVGAVDVDVLTLARAPHPTN